jgi:hypothetical protein
VASAEAALAKLCETQAARDAELSQSRTAVIAAKQQLDDARYDMLEMNYNFYESTVATLDGLFELSPYGRKLLKPLQTLLLSALAYVERPPKLDKAEMQRRIDDLNRRLEIAVSKEDYAEAEVIQTQIDKLSSKLTR